MKNKYYRCSINSVPENQERLRNSAIPLFFSVEFENPEISAPLVKEAIVKCAKCKGYLNPYVEVIMPGFKWRCNLCDNVNSVEQPFIMTERRNNDFPKDAVRNSMFNRASFVRKDLRNDFYEIEPGEGYSVQTPEAPVLCFIVDVSNESEQLSVLQSVSRSVKEVMRSVIEEKRYDARTKVAFVFYSRFVYLLRRNGTFAVITESIPKLLPETCLFPLEEFGNVDFDRVHRYFEGQIVNESNLVLPFEVILHAFRMATVFCFVAGIPNSGVSALKNTVHLSCQNPVYKTLADNLQSRSIAVNLFLLTRSSLELSTLGFLAQHTGGKIFHYANYDGRDPTSVTKLFCDLSYHFKENMGFSGLCRIRASEGVILRGVYGNCKAKSENLLRFANWHSSHIMNISFMVINNVSNALYVQIAMIRTNKKGERLIRVFNICVPVRSDELYDVCSAPAIAHALLLEAIEVEKKKKDAGNLFLENSLLKILKESRKQYGKLSVALADLPRLILSARKIIPLRPDTRTPVDFRVYYAYLFSNMFVDIIDVMLYPILINPNDPNLTNLTLSVTSIISTEFYILYTGINLFFYFGKDCDKSKYASLFGSFTTGPFLFVPDDTDEYSQYIVELVDVFLVGNKSRKPNFFIVDGASRSVGGDSTGSYAAFHTYLYCDTMYGLPSLDNYMSDLKKIIG